MSFDLNQIRFDESGLIPAIVQDARTGEVLTLAYMNGESLRKTLETCETWFWSRSRSELWHKGATSGNTQRVAAVHQDCDSDALVVQVEPAGPACHTGKRSCFYRDLEGEEVDEAVKVNNLGAVLNELYDLIESRRRDRPEGSYTTYLFEQGLDKILKKLGEEACETIIAAKNDEKEPLISESADLLYHLIVLLVGRGVSLDEVKVELISRRTKGASSDR
ncbi:MAG TPA: bifunctional phosphoribosyl-AMP cyclohydrolase/phosphoribosyl-ATP diphosphatase HisIE [Pyrinomonadaceae bacterium]